MTDSEARASPQGDALETMVRLADTLIPDYDLFAVLDDIVASAARLTSASGACVVVFADDDLEIVVAANGGVEVIDDGNCGPCWEVAELGGPLEIEVSRARERWPRWAPAAERHGYRHLYVTPLKHQQRVIGVLAIYTTAQRFASHELLVADALASVAAIGIVYHDLVADQSEVNGQLQRALDSRIVIEQAKGMVMAQLGCDADAAFERIRHRARSLNSKLHDIAHRIVGGELAFVE